MNVPARVLVISPRALIRMGIVALLRESPFIKVVGDSDDWDRRTTLDCDVALWDVGDVTPQSAPIRLLVAAGWPRQARVWLQAGAAGCSLETASAEELPSAIARGETFLSPSVVQESISATGAGREPAESKAEPLTERDVLKPLVQGLSNKAIAQKLYVGVRTEEGLLANTYGKLHPRSRTEAVLWASRNLKPLERRTRGRKLPSAASGLCLWSR